MRAIQYHEHGGPVVLTTADVDVPEPEPNAVRIAAHAAAVNPVDTYFREGTYETAGLPRIPGSDVAGVVDAVGEDVEGLEEGDRVFGTALGRDVQGTCAEFVVAPEDRLAILPDAVDFDVGAAAALVGVTAWRALLDHARLRPADRCLIHGGSGGVGHVAVQLAAATGAHVTATAAPSTHDRLAELGADRTLDYDRADLETAIVEGGAPDVVLDHRLDDYFQLDADVAAHGARIVGIGENSKAAGFSNVGLARSKELSVHLMSMFNTPDVSAVLSRLATLLEAGELTAHVARTYPLEDVADAQRAVMDERFVGKLVVEIR